jgi:hypothetical protein
MTGMTLRDVNQLTPGPAAVAAGALGGIVTNRQARYPGPTSHTRHGADARQYRPGHHHRRLSPAPTRSPHRELAEHQGIPALAGPFTRAALRGVLFLLPRPDPLLASAPHRCRPARPRASNELTDAASQNRHRRGGHQGPHPTRPGRRHDHDTGPHARQRPRPARHRPGHRRSHRRPCTCPHRSPILVDRVPIAATPASPHPLRDSSRPPHPDDSAILLTVALALLGLGWNFGLMSGTAMTTDPVSVEVRAKRRLPATAPPSAPPVTGADAG